MCLANIRKYSDSRFNDFFQRPSFHLFGKYLLQSGQAHDVRSSARYSTERQFENYNSRTADDLKLVFQQLIQPFFHNGFTITAGNPNTPEDHIAGDEKLRYAASPKTIFHQNKICFRIIFQTNRLINNKIANTPQVKLGDKSHDHCGEPHKAQKTKWFPEKNQSATVSEQLFHRSSSWN